MAFMKNVWHTANLPIVTHSYCQYSVFKSISHQQRGQSLCPYLALGVPEVPQHNASLKVCISWQLSLILPQVVSKMFFSWSWAEHKIGSHTRVSLSYFREGGNGSPHMGGGLSPEGGEWRMIWSRQTNWPIMFLKGVYQLYKRWNKDYWRSFNKESTL